MQEIRCLQTSYLVKTLEHRCKSTAHVLQVHAQAIARGLFSLYPSLIYSQILHSFTSTKIAQQARINGGSIARYPAKIFNLIPNPSTFNYNSVIRAQTLLSNPGGAFEFFVGLRRNSVPPDFHTYPFVLKACGSLQGARSPAEALHAELVKVGFLCDAFVSNTLGAAYCRFGRVDSAEKVFESIPHRDVVSYNVVIDGLVKAGMIDRAREVFDEMPQRDCFSWGTLLAGYAKCNRCSEAIELFDRMVDSNVRFDNIALVSSLSACAQLADLNRGKKIHKYIEANGIELDSYIGTALVDLYSKCGCLTTAKEVFECCTSKNTSLWNAMILGLAMHGSGTPALEHFSRMLKEGIKPDDITILGILIGCSHAGLVEEARKIFSNMENLYNVKRELKHYGCMSDLLSRAGLIREAVEMIEAMPVRGDVFVWGGLLGGCKLHGNLEIAEEAAKNVIEVKPEDAGVYSVLAHMYVNSNRWDDLVKVRRYRDSTWGLKKMAGRSSIELDGIVYEFVSGDCLHPQTVEIHFVLNGLEVHVCESNDITTV